MPYWTLVQCTPPLAKTHFPVALFHYVWPPFARHPDPWVPVTAVTLPASVSYLVRPLVPHRRSASKPPAS